MSIPSQNYRFRVHLYLYTVKGIYTEMSKLIYLDIRTPVFKFGVDGAEKLVNVLDRIAHLIREDPAITVAEIARRLGYSEEKSVYYWLEKASIKGIKEFKRIVLTEQAKESSDQTRSIPQATPGPVEQVGNQASTRYAGRQPTEPAGVREETLKTGLASFEIPIRVQVRQEPVQDLPVTVPLVHEEALSPDPPFVAKEALEASEQSVQICLSQKPKSRSFAVKVTSDSLRPTFLPGDILIIECGVPVTAGSVLLGRGPNQDIMAFVAVEGQDAPTLVDAAEPRKVYKTSQDVSVIGQITALVRYYR